MSIGASSFATSLVFSSMRATSSNRWRSDLSNSARQSCRSLAHIRWNHPNIPGNKRRICVVEIPANRVAAPSPPGIRSRTTSLSGDGARVPPLKCGLMYSFASSERSPQAIESFGVYLIKFVLWTSLGLDSLIGLTIGWPANSFFLLLTMQGGGGPGLAGGMFLLIRCASLRMSRRGRACHSALKGRGARAQRLTPGAV